MDIFNIPELLEIPDPAPDDENPAATTAFLMTALLRKNPAVLYADFRGGDGRWWVRDSAQHEECVAESKGVGHFRSILARFGHCFMGDQLYGGHARLSVEQNGQKFACEIFMSNQGWTGYWIRVYARAV